jgi:hypothetical protein
MHGELSARPGALAVTDNDQWMHARADKSIRACSARGCF